MNDSKQPVVLVLFGSGNGTELVERSARAVARVFQADLRRINYGKAAQCALPEDPPGRTVDPRATLPKALQEVRGVYDVKMIVAEWPGRSEDIFYLLNLLKGVSDVPSMLVRNGGSGTQPRNALVPASGGPHIIQCFWAAREISMEFKLTPRLLCVEPGMSYGKSKGNADPCSTGAGAARLVGMKAPLHLCGSDNVTDGILQHVRPDDLVILGGPNYARLGEYFEGTIPDVISKSIPNDIVMILGRRPTTYNLRDMFWEEMVCMNMAPLNKKDAIAMLIDKLIKNHQIPARWRQYMLEKALKREAILPTVTDAEAAFPHVTVPGISGIIGALGFCPEGIDFGCETLPAARIIFLMVTPTQHYDDYLLVLSDIATIMISPERRFDILKSRSPSELLDKLEKYQNKLCPQPP